MSSAARGPIVLYASDHGYGHAMRLLALCEALRARSLPVTFCAGAALAAARPTLDRLGAVAVPVSLDPGLCAAPDRIAIDEARSRREVLGWLRHLPDLVATEAARLRALRARLVIADAPAAAVAAAARAGVPAVVLSNFSWIDLYGPRFGEGAVRDLRDAYAGASLGLRLRLGALALAGPPRIRDVDGILGRPARRSRAEIRARLGLRDDEPVLALGLGRSIPAGSLQRLCRHTRGRTRILAPADSLPRGAALPFPAGDPDPQDYLAAADAVLAKGGYGTLAEVALAGTPLIVFPVAGNAESAALCRDVAALGLGIALAGEEEAAHLLAAPEDALALARAVRPTPQPAAAPRILETLTEEGLLG